ncbi:MAG: DUF6231 family protein [Pseudomonadota bacterium]
MLSTVNEKKITAQCCLLADPEAREALTGFDKPLIACEKARPGDARITVVMVDEKDLADPDEVALRLLDDPAVAGTELPEGALIDVIIATEHWLPEVSRLLASLRDRGNRPVVVYLDETVDDRLKMIALGYRAASGDEPVYLFDIHDYKQTPDWLNPRNWANPEMWDKYRW